MNNKITYLENEYDKMVYIYKGNDIVATCNYFTKEITTYLFFLYSFFRTRTPLLE